MLLSSFLVDVSFLSLD